MAGTLSQDKALADLTRGLGWFSIAIGASELLAPRRISRGLGMRRPGLFQAYGLREILAGVGILAAKDPRVGVWARVAGDVLDLASVAPALTKRHHRGNAAAVLGLIAGAIAADVYCATKLTARPPANRSVQDYSDRSGFPHPPDKMRGLALSG